MQVYKRFPKIPETKIVDGMIDLLTQQYVIKESLEIQNTDIVFVGGFRTSLQNIKKLEHNNFINIDKGYIQPNKKVTDYWRMTFNNFQQRSILDVPGDRLKDFEISPWNKSGSYILILAPNPDPVQYYCNSTSQQWVEQVKIKLLGLTDRKIFVRYKDNKKIRSHDPFAKYLKDCYAVVSLQSVGCVESIAHGVPAINLAPSCLDGLYKSDLNNIENLEYPKNRYEWFKSLSYSQFTWNEMKTGVALNIIEQYHIT